MLVCMLSWPLWMHVAVLCRISLFTHGFFSPLPPAPLLIAAFSFGARALVCASVHIVRFCFPALLFLSLVPLLLASYLEIHVELNLHQLLDAAVSPPPSPPRFRLCDCLKVFTALSYFSSKIMVAVCFFFMQPWLACSLNSFLSHVVVFLWSSHSHSNSKHATCKVKLSKV